MAIINPNISKRVLTIGCSYKRPKGGVAQVLNVYSSMFSPFRFIESVEVYDSVFCKIFVAIKSIVQLVYYCIFDRDISIIHIHGASYNSFYRKRIYIYISKFFGKKVIYHIHGAEFRKFSTEHKTAVMKVLKKCDAVIALSESWKKYFEECLNAPNVHVINNVIPLPKVMPTYSQEKCVKFLFLGYLGVRKGIYDLLEAISSHILNLENRALFYVGGNGETAEVQQYIAEKGLCNVVKFCGWVSGDEKVKLLNESDVYVLPSYNEGLPISILEAMSYGMPIITSNVGGIPEIVNEDNGIIVEPGNKQQIYEAICSMLNNPSLVQIKGNFSLSKVKTYLPEMVCSQLTKLYKSLI